MRKQFFKEALLAVALAAFSSTAAMGQSGEQKQKEMTDWLKDVADRVELHGYAQGGFNYTHQNAEDKGTFEPQKSPFLGQCSYHRPMVVPFHARLLERRTGVLH